MKIQSQLSTYDPHINVRRAVRSGRMRLGRTGPRRSWRGYDIRKSVAVCAHPVHE